MSEPFYLGYRPDKEADAKQAWAASGQPPRFTSASFADPAPIPAAFSLADLILWWTNQNQLGSCALDSTTTSLSLSVAYAVKYLGAALEEVQFSRAFAWYHARKMDGLLGGRGEGASVTNSLRSYHEFGACPDSISPYNPPADFMPRYGENDRRFAWCERRPSPEAVAAAKGYGLKGLVDLRFDDSDGIKRSIYNGNPPVMGVWWPSGWSSQSQIDQYGRTRGIGGGQFGHALAVIGWVDPGVWDKSRWWHIKNSHGPIYPLPSPEMRSKVQGYASAREDRCFAFWLRDDHFRTVAGYGQSELVAPVGPYTPDPRSPASWENAAS